MQRIFAVVLALAASIGWSSPVLSQQDRDTGVPVEFFACDWRDGKGMDDLMKVAKRFDQWADKRDTGYSAWILTPQFHDNLDYDVGWLGSWSDANDFGRLQDAWMKDGRDIAAAFDAVADCSKRHQMATSAIVNAPNGPPANGIVMFSSCTLSDKTTALDALEAHRRMGSTMREMGSKAMSWLFYPSLGVSEDLDYWSVIAFNNYTDMGSTMDLWTNGEGWKKAALILGPVSDCASPAVFDAHLVRAGAQN